MTLIEFYGIPLDEKVYRDLNKNRPVNHYFSPKYVGQCMKLMSDFYHSTDTLSKKAWERYYGQVEGFEGLTYVTDKLEELLPDLDRLTIKQYIFYRVIGQTWNGFANELLVINELKQEFPSCDILKTSFDIDHEYCIDAEMFYESNLLLGIQIKPITYKLMNTQYQKWSKENHRQKNLLYQNLYAPYVYVYYDNHKIVDKDELLNQISTIIHFNI